MALEELLLAKAAQQNRAQVRFFDFAKDSAVLGYAQATDVLKKRDDTFDITRRCTGGSHVQTGQNVLAYTFAVPRDGSFTHYEDMRAYYAQLVAEALGDLGIKELEVNNRESTIKAGGKIVASHAVLWGVRSALLHGLIIIDPYDVDRVDQRLKLQARKIGNNEYSEYSALKNLPAVSNLLDSVAKNASEEARSAALKELVSAAILEKVTKGRHENEAISDKAIFLAQDLLEKKYGKPVWIEERKPEFTKAEVEEIPGEELNGPLKKNLGYCLFLQVENKDFKKMAEPSEACEQVRQSRTLARPVKTGMSPLGP
jgi:lipoate-protein ligase A